MDQTEEKTPKETEDFQAIVIKVGEQFNFFLDTISTDERSKIQISTLDGIGTIVGIATSINAAQVHGPDNMAVTFDIQTTDIEPKSSPGENIPNDPAQDLYLEAETTDNRRSIAKGRVQTTETLRSVVFDDWYDIGRSKSKEEILATIQNRVGNPLTVKTSELTKTVFKFLKGSQI